MSVFPQLPDFIFTEKLGRGSYATVYKAYRKDAKREVVAIKCVLKSSLTKSSVENLLTEISILKNVKHEHIVELKDFQWDNTYIYLILEYCSGGDLSRFVRRKHRLPESVVQKFLQQLVSALKVLHSKNIAHMDLKPQNVLLSSSHNPVLKLGDFGFAQYLHPEKDGSSLRGSPLYMAPEILLNHRYDTRVDLWSVGIILYECLFGQAPFTSNTFAELAEKIKSSKPVELPYGAKVSDACRNFLLRLLQRDPEKRITFQEFFEHPFVDLEHMPTSESYDKGVKLVQQAVDADGKSNFEEAVNLYRLSLEYLVPHVCRESDRVRREEFRKKLFGYINRAEELKKLLKAPSVPTNDVKIHNAVTELGGLLYDKPHLQSALCLALEADELVSRNNFEEALNLYQRALEIMVPAVTREPPGRSKEIMYTEVDQWMKKAEDLKAFIQAANYQKEAAKQEGTSQPIDPSLVQYNIANDNLSCVIQ